MADFNTPRISEKKFYAIPDQLFSADGTDKGLITVISTYGYKVGQVVSISSTTQQPRRLKIKRVVSETQFHVGDEKSKIWEYTDISLFLISESAKVSLIEQERPVIHINEIQRQIYEEEPTVALRTHSVDYLGRSYDDDNPIPTKLIGDGVINVNLSADSISDLQDIQDTSNTILTEIQANTEGLATVAKQDNIITELQNINSAQIILNIKEQILRAIDREQNIIYADFGTKNQRITEINYSAISVGSQIAKKLITYTLVGNKYRRDSIDWSIV